eukprot:6010372-Prymnesium_polylepis.1
MEHAGDSTARDAVRLSLPSFRIAVAEALTHVPSVTVHTWPEGRTNLSPRVCGAFVPRTVRFP